MPYLLFLKVNYVTHKLWNAVSRSGLTYSCFLLKGKTVSVHEPSLPTNACFEVGSGRQRSGLLKNHLKVKHEGSDFLGLQSN